MRAAALVCALSAAAFAATTWLTLQPGAQEAQTGLVLWFNDPPQPVAAVLGASNALLRPVPLTVVCAVLLGWVLLRAGGRRVRLEEVRALGLSFLLAELLAQGAKRVVDQPRPLSVVEGLDQHGYPTDPRGMSYPSAHTAVAVAVVCALWPWMTRPQRTVGAVLAVLVAANRIYIGAHWPLDVLGGAAVGLLAASVTWLIAARWPLAGDDA